jgi:peptide/nickel transport system ATP-binding protein
MTTPALLQIKNLHVMRDAGGRPVVDNMSLSVHKGEVLALIGESGSGKTTLALSALGRIRPGLHVESGGVELDGVDLLAASHRELRALRGRSVSYIAQSAAMSFNQRMCLDRQVTEPARAHGALPAAEALKRAHALYESLDLPTPNRIGERFPHEVSGGQLQRFMIAMGLLLHPNLVVCDEPTSALDVTTQVEVLRALKAAIREQHTAALFVSHDLAVVAQIADRIAVLRHGQLIEIGTTEDILEHPAEAYTRQLIAACQRWPAHTPGASERGVGGSSTAASRSSTDSMDPPASNPGASTTESPAPSAPSPPYLTAKNITAGYGPVNARGEPAVTVLKDVSLLVRRGQVVAVIGESGSGKSTFARVISGMHAQAKGDVTLENATLPPGMASRTKEQLRRVQMVFQSADTALNSKHTVGRILTRALDFFGRVPKVDIPARVDALLRMVNLPVDYAQRRPSQLSGGEKQRVNLARALAADPEVLICDEITSALDTVVAAAIVELIEDLRDRLNLAIILISHDMATVGSLADEVLVLQKGRVVEHGPTLDVLTRPSMPYTRLLMGSVPELRRGWLEDVALAASE